MTGQSDSLEHTAYLAPHDAATYLETLARHIRSGAFRLSARDESVDLTPGRTIKLDVAVRQKLGKTRGAITLKLSWRRTSALQDLPAIESTEPVAGVAAPPIRLRIGPDEEPESEQGGASSA